MERHHITLSKRMSLLLRHRPDAGGLVLDEAGTVPISALLSALHPQPGLEWVTEADIRFVVTHSDKQRFQIVGERIGARYGHNRDVRPVNPGPLVEPPALLYHGTPRRALAAILREGLTPQGRQMVHLSRTVDTAQRVGQRHDRDVALLHVAAAEAYRAGIPFYAPTPDTFLARHVPPAYLTLAEAQE